MRNAIGGVLDELCKMSGLMFVLLVAEILFAIVLTPAYFFIERGSGTYVVWVMDMVGLAGLILLTGTFLAVCYRR